MSVGKKRRLTFIECNNDINTMIDLAKVADLVSVFHELLYMLKTETLFDGVLFLSPGPDADRC